MHSKKNAVILLSGGLDSSTVLAIAKEQGYRIYALSFRYGQRHEQELRAASEVAADIGVEQHVVAQIDLAMFGGSALTTDIEVPKYSATEELSDEIPVTYVPARNTVFLSFALAWAEVLAAEDIFIGVNALDYSGYPDCRPEYIEAFQSMANLATKAAAEGSQKYHIHTPLIDMSKGQIVQAGLSLGVDYSKTISCYDPDDSRISCGRCDACILRLKGFADAGVKDPIRYVKSHTSPGF